MVRDFKDGKMKEVKVKGEQLRVVQLERKLYELSAYFIPHSAKGAAHRAVEDGERACNTLTA